MMFFNWKWAACAIVLLLGMFACFLVVNRTSVTTYPDQVLRVIEKESELLSKVDKGDVEAALVLSDAYAFIDPTSNRSFEVLEKVKSSGDRQVEAQLGRILLNRVLRAKKAGESVDAIVLAEALRLLKLAKEKGSKEAFYDLEVARDLLGVV